MSPPAGRPREFDESEVLDCALTAFWKKGFEATSVQDLLQATGLTKGSLYQAFGDKRALFLLTLSNYLERGRQNVRACLAARGTVKKKLGCALRVSELAKEGTRGCYAVNSLVEMAPHDPAVQALLSEHFRIFERLLSEEIEAGRTRGEHASSLSSSKLASLLITLLIGAAAASRGHLDVDQANRNLRAALDSLL